MLIIGLADLKVNFHNKSFGLNLITNKNERESSQFEIDTV